MFFKFVSSGVHEAHDHLLPPRHVESTVMGITELGACALRKPPALQSFGQRVMPCADRAPLCGDIRRGLFQRVLPD